MLNTIWAYSAAVARGCLALVSERHSVKQFRVKFRRDWVMQTDNE